MKMRMKITKTFREEDIYCCCFNILGFAEGDFIVLY